MLQTGSPAPRMTVGTRITVWRGRRWAGLKRSAQDPQPNQPAGGSFVCGRDL